MNEFLLSLQITALGMGLVFGSIMLLWLMMVLLTRFTAAKTSISSSESEPINQTEPAIRKQVAAIAVALALSEQEFSSAHPLPEPPTALVSAWQLGMRTRQMSEKGNFRKYKNS